MVLAAEQADRLVNMAKQDYDLFEGLIERIYRDVCRPGDVLVDGGAHTGRHTLPMASVVGDSGTVFAFEPVVESATILRARLAHAGHSCVLVDEKALSNERGEVEFAVVRNATTRSGLRVTPAPFDMDIDQVKAQTVLLDDILQGVGSWRFGKFDLEGGELHALVGAQQSLRSLRPLLVFERSILAPEWYEYTPEDFFSFFHSVGYQVFDLFGDPILEDQWSRVGRPWYSLGVPKDTAHQRWFQGGPFSALLGSFAAAEIG
jgi:FkbM family methyltransferase